MPSRLQQRLYLGGLPPGLNMTVTAVMPSVSNDKGLGITFSRYDVGSTTINRYGTFDNITDKLPFAVATSTLGGLIGEVSYDRYSGLLSPGLGGNVDITVRIQGTTIVNGNIFIVDYTGYITVSTTGWRWFERPDYSFVSHCWGAAPVVLTITVPPSITGQPDDVYFTFGVDGDKIGVYTTLSSDL